MADFFSRILSPFVRRNGWTKAQQQLHYKRIYNTFDRQGDKYGRQDIPSATEMEDVTTTSVPGDFGVQSANLNMFVHSTEQPKIQKLSLYRGMAMFPEISFALGEIQDEAVNFNSDGEVLNLKIKNPIFQQNENVMRNLHKEWDYLMNEVVNVKKYIYEWFMAYMIDGEIYLEKVVDPITAKERGILRVKHLLPEYTYPIWQESESDDIAFFVHKNETNLIQMPIEMIAYANSGFYDRPDRFTKIVKSYLDVAKVDYRKLRQMEDAVVIYRLVRAPERRVFKIEVAGMPKAKAEAYVQGLIKKYRQRKTYDPNTGEASQTIDTLAMVEDYWLPSQNGKGSSIDTLPGGDNLGQIDDVLYFLDKLYRALRIPMSRVKSDTGFSLGDTSDITREEVRFHKMVLQFTTRFKDIFSQLYISHLRLKGYADEYGITEHDFEVQMIGNNIFEEALETDILTRRSENFERFVGYTENDPETGKKALFNLNWLMRKFLKFTDDDISENDMWLSKDKTNYNTENSGGGDSGSSSDSGGFGGGSKGGSDDFGSDSSGKDSDPESGSDKPDEKPEKPDNSKDLESFA
jgi:uncharacterized membrane protein YgcG